MTSLTVLEKAVLAADHAETLARQLRREADHVDQFRQDLLAGIDLLKRARTSAPDLAEETGAALTEAVSRFEASQADLVAVAVSVPQVLAALLS